MKTFIARLLLTLALLLIVTRLPPRAASLTQAASIEHTTMMEPAAPTTNVCGAININTTWSLIDSPYEVCNGGVTIGPTATLTIEPGVTIQFFNSTGSKLNVNYGGALSAIGTLTRPITFTGVVAAPGSWGGLSAIATVTPSLINLS